jgi:cytochrome P450
MSSEAAVRRGLFDPEVSAQPFGFYERLQEDAPVWFDEQLGMWVLSRYEDVRMALLDHRFSVEMSLAAQGGPEGEDEGAEQASAAPGCPVDGEAWYPPASKQGVEVERRVRQVFERDGCVAGPGITATEGHLHRDLLRLYKPFFQPEALAELEPMIELQARRLIETFVGDGHCEWVAQFARLLPMHVTGEWIGMVEADLARAREWSEAFVARSGMAQTLDERLGGARLEVEAQAYFEGKFAQLRENPDGTVLSELANQRIEALGRNLNNNELQAEALVDIVVGGLESNSNTLTTGAYFLARRPDLWQKLKSEPELWIPPFVEEILRVESPLQGLVRMTTEDVELHGVVIPAGSGVVVRVGAGNRDARRYAAPAEIDLGRRQTRSHLGFGTGEHHCAGAPFARQLQRIGFATMLEYLEDVALVEGWRPTFKPNYFVRQMEWLPLQFSAAA